MTIYVKYFGYNEAMMTNLQVENLINAHREREKEQRNCMLRARLSRPLTSEEHLKRIAMLAEFVAPRQGEEIPLTKSSSQYIMEIAR